MLSRIAESPTGSDFPIRGKASELVERCIKAYCADAGRAQDEREFVFIKRGFGYNLSSRFVDRMCVFLEILPQLLTGGTVTLRLPLDAEIIRVKNNIRIFFGASGHGGRPLTAKVAIPAAHQTGSLRQEVEARQRLDTRQSSRFALPRIERYDAAGFTWLEEEFIEESKGISETEKVQIFLDDAAAGIYGDGRQSAEVRSVLASEGLDEGDLVPVLDELGLDRGFLAKTWTVSFTHGDLSPANMIPGHDGRLHLIDWELSKMAPIAWDLKKIVFLDGPGTLRILDQLRLPGDVSAREQMALAQCCELAYLRKNDGGRFSYLRTNRNKSESAARQMMTKYEQKLVGSISALMSAEAQQRGHRP